MPGIQGQKIGSWDSNFGQAQITVKEKIGSTYPSQIEAHKAIVKAGEQGAIIKNEAGGFSAYSIDDGATLDDLDAGEQYQLNQKGKAAGIVDFIGDDGASLETGTIVKPPNAKKDKHESVYFTYTLNPETLKGKYHKLSIGMVNGGLQKDEIADLQNRGYTVVVDKTATKEDIQNALYDPTTAAWVNVGHGSAGAVCTYDDEFLFPQFKFDLDPEKVSPRLKMAYIQSCQTGELQEDWQKALGTNTKIYNWSRTASNTELMMVNGGSSLSLKNILLKPGLSTILNPYAWKGETLQQTLDKHLK